MRQIGQLAQEADARRFRDFLLTRGIEAEARGDGAAYAIWVRQEDDVAPAQAALTAFRADPADPRYDVAGEATALRRQAAAEAAARQSKVRDIRPAWVGPAASPGRIPITLALLTASILVSILTGFGKRVDQDLSRTLMFSDPARSLVELEGWLRSGQIPPYETIVRSRFAEIARGQVWRVVTPIFVHFGVWHILFNGLFLFQLGGLIERKLGWWRYLLVIVAAAVVGNVGQAVAPFEMIGLFVPGPNVIPVFGGLSGVLYGVFAWMVVSGLVRTGTLIVPGGSVLMLALWFLLGATGAAASMGLTMANWCHFGGIVAGAALGLVIAPPSGWYAGPGSP